MRYALAVFDLDGTILNTLDDLTDALNHALGAEGFALRTQAEVKAFVGNGIRKLVERGAPADCDEKTLVSLYLNFTEFYSEHCADKTAPYEGIAELMRKLKDGGVKIAVVSNKADYAVRSLVNKHFGKTVDFAFGATEGVSLKPAPDLVNKVVELSGVDKSKTVYIGDSEVDIQTASNAKVDCISVCWGFRDKDFLLKNGASVVVNTAEDLYQIFCK